MKCVSTQVQTQTGPMSLWSFCPMLTLCQIWLHFSTKLLPSSGAKINRADFPYTWDRVFLCASSKMSKFMSKWGGMCCSVLYPAQRLLGRWNNTPVLDWDEDDMGHQHLWKQVRPHFTQLWVSNHSNSLCCDHLQCLLWILLCQRRTSRDLHTFEVSVIVLFCDRKWQAGLETSAFPLLSWSPSRLREFLGIPTGFRLQQSVHAPGCLCARCRDEHLQREHSPRLKTPSTQGQESPFTILAGEKDMKCSHPSL